MEIKKTEPRIDKIYETDELHVEAYFNVSDIQSDGSCGPTGGPDRTFPCRISMGISLENESDDPEEPDEPVMWLCVGIDRKRQHKYFQVMLDMEDAKQVHRMLGEMISMQSESLP